MAAVLREFALLGIRTEVPLGLVEHPVVVTHALPIPLRRLFELEAEVVPVGADVVALTGPGVRFLIPGVAIVAFDPGQGDLVLFVAQLREQAVHGDPVGLVGHLIPRAGTPARLFPPIKTLVDALDHVLGVRIDDRLVQALIEGVRECLLCG
ncbi:hypothetical protein D3C73_951110 [compost metagenome]